jgi:hypothetical protein
MGGQLFVSINKCLLGVNVLGKKWDPRRRGDDGPSTSEVGAGFAMVRGCR